jgi:hypothetical protein
MLQIYTNYSFFKLKGWSQSAGEEKSEPTSDHQTSDPQTQDCRTARSQASRLLFQSSFPEIFDIQEKGNCKGGDEAI